MTKQTSTSPQSVLDERLPIDWGIISDAEAQSYQTQNTVVTISEDNAQKLEALQGLLTVLTKDHSDDNKQQ
jgi:hypothetical protein